MHYLDEIIRKLDPVVWRAHFLVRLPEEAAHLSFAVPATGEEWELYWRQTRRESRGYWHGASGRIAERLGYLPEDDDDERCSDEWLRMVRFHHPGPAKNLGDSSHDYSYLIQRAGACDGETAKAKA